MLTNLLLFLLSQMLQPRCEDVENKFPDNRTFVFPSSRWQYSNSLEVGAFTQTREPKNAVLHEVMSITDQYF